MSGSGCSAGPLDLLDLEAVPKLLRKFAGHVDVFARESLQSSAGASAQGNRRQKGGGQEKGAAAANGIPGIKVHDRSKILGNSGSLVEAANDADPAAKMTAPLLLPVADKLDFRLALIETHG